MFLHVSLIQVYVGCFDGQRAAARHCVTCVDGQVNDNLLNLAGVSLDVSEDKTMLYVHVMFLDDVEEARRTIKEGLERRVLEVMR